MTLSDELAGAQRIFIDTAPFIYYLGAHPKFGPLIKEIVTEIQSGKLNAFSSVITLVEVLPKPVENGNEILAKQFSEFLESGENITLLDISAEIAKHAGMLRGRYASLRAMDAIQIASALKINTDLFITNDLKLKEGA